MTNQPRNPGTPPPTAVICCAVLADELEHLARGLGHIVHREILEQGLHNEPDKLRRHLQQAVDRIEAETAAEAIVFGYGLCSRGIEGVGADRCRLVIPRAHDCITLLLGDHQRYAEYVACHPGTYWYSPGWNRHHVPPGPQRYRERLECYRRQFGEEDARYLMQNLENWYHTYDRATYVDLGLGDNSAAVQYTRRCAEWLGWTFDHQTGDPALLEALLAGPWDEQRFLILEPGQCARLTGDDRVIDAIDRSAWTDAADRSDGGGQINA
jgi:hypothetical protein